MAEADLSRLRIDRATEPTPSRRPFVLVLVLVFVLGSLAAGFLWLRPTDKPELEVHVVARPGAGGEILQAAGFIKAQRVSSLSSMVEGLIIEVNVKVGDAVTENDVIARLDDRDFVYARDRVQAQLDLARSEESRIEKLVKTDARAEIELERAESARKQIEEDLKSAQKRVDDCVIRATFAGVVVQKNAEVGERVSMMGGGAGTSAALVTILDPTSLQAEVDVNEAHKERVRLGMPCEILPEGLPPYRGLVDRIERQVDRAKATVKVKVAFAELDDRVLDGQSVRVRFLESEAVAEPIRVPANCVRDGKVWIVTGETVESRPVRVGAERDGRVEVLDGLRGGERIVVNPK